MLLAYQYDLEASLPHTAEDLLPSGKYQSSWAGGPQAPHTFLIELRVLYPSPLFPSIQYTPEVGGQSRGFQLRLERAPLLLRNQIEQHPLHPKQGQKGH